MPPAPSSGCCWTGAARSPSPPPASRATIPIAINNRGQIVGVTAPTRAPDGPRVPAAKGASGPFTPINVPGAPSTWPRLNDPGVIVGAYTNPNATPSPPPATPPPMARMA